LAILAQHEFFLLSPFLGYIHITLKFFKLWVIYLISGETVLPSNEFTSDVKVQLYWLGIRAKWNFLLTEEPFDSFYYFYYCAPQQTSQWTVHSKTWACPEDLHLSKWSLSSAWLIQQRTASAIILINEPEEKQSRQDTNQISWSAEANLSPPNFVSWGPTGEKQKKESQAICCTCKPTISPSVVTFPFSHLANTMKC
jgi:hypothetical protein